MRILHPGSANLAMTEKTFFARREFRKLLTNMVTAPCGRVQVCGWRLGGKRRLPRTASHQNESNRAEAQAQTPYSQAAMEKG
jgi:hypothetical protein